MYVITSAPIGAWKCKFPNFQKGGGKQKEEADKSEYTATKVHVGNESKIGDIFGQPGKYVSELLQYQ